MKNFVRKHVISLAILCAAGGAHSSTLTFEDLNPAPADFDVMTTYGGFSFTNWLYGPDTAYSPASGAIDLFTNYADPGNVGDDVVTNDNAITRTTGFIFEGAWFSGYSGVTFELWRDGTFLGAFGSLPDAPGVDAYGPTFLASGYAGLVDKVVVSGVQGYYAMDDFSFREPAPAVPEPDAWALLVAGLGLVVGRRPWRRKYPSRS